MESGIESAASDLTTVQEKLDEAYSSCTELYNEILSSGEWKGEAQKALIAYMDLLKQYLGTLAGKEGGLEPVARGEKAYSDLEAKLNAFYDNYSSYKRLEALS
jgi:hypothetical protein